MKNIVWGVIAILVIVLGVWMYKSRDTPSEAVVSDTTTTTDTTTTGGTSSTGTQTFKSLFSEKGNFICVYEQVDPKYRSTNTIYLSDGKMRAEFRTSSSTGSLANLMVYDGMNLYVWKEGMTVGVRTQPRSVSELPSVIPTDITSAAVLGTSPKNVSYDCHAWSKDASLLVKPAYVKFN